MNVNENFNWLHVGLPEEISRLRDWGDYPAALRVIDRYLGDSRIPDALRHCLLAEREMLRRIPAEYPFDREQAISLVQERMQNFQAGEFDAWEDAGRIDWIFRDGKKHYFHRFLDSLCKTDLDIAKRCGEAQLGADGHDENGYLKEALEEMHQMGETCRRIRCQIELRLKDPAFIPGMRVRVYLPLPVRCLAQEAVRIEAHTEAPLLIAPEEQSQRTVIWDSVLSENHPFFVRFSYLRRERYLDLWRKDPGAKWAERQAAHYRASCSRMEEPGPEDLREQAPHILFTPFLKELSNRLTGEQESALEKARAIYWFITGNVRYRYMRSYFGLEHIAENGAKSLSGDCGVMALLFLTLCRASGIPARWESGWKAAPDFCGAHDWVYFYAEPYGWIPADPSFGAGAFREGNEGRRRHYFGNLDPFRMAANTAFQAPFAIPMRQWRSDPYDNQVGEAEAWDTALWYQDWESKKEVLCCERID